MKKLTDKISLGLSLVLVVIEAITRITNILEAFKMIDKILSRDVILIGLAIFFLGVYVYVKIKEYKDKNKEKIAQIESEYREKLEIHLDNHGTKFLDMQTTFGKLVQTVDFAYKDFHTKFVTMDYLKDSVDSLNCTIQKLNETITNELTKKAEK